MVNRGDGGKLESRVRIRVYGGRINVAPYLGTNAFRAL